MTYGIMYIESMMRTMRRSTAHPIDLIVQALGKSCRWPECPSNLHHSVYSRQIPAWTDRDDRVAARAPWHSQHAHQQTCSTWPAFLQAWPRYPVLRIEISWVGHPGIDYSRSASCESRFAPSPAVSSSLASSSIVASAATLLASASEAASTAGRPVSRGFAGAAAAESGF